MPDCVFCKIIQGELPCAEIFSNDTVMAFLDIGPLVEGHTLIVPREHYENIWECPPALGAALTEAMQRVGRAVMAGTGASGLNMVMNNGAAAGQLVPHAHWHLIPRIEGDGLLHVQQKEYESRQHMEALAEQIRHRISERAG